MALPVESFEIEAQAPTASAQEPGTLRKAAPILLGASCLAALALFHNGTGSLAASPQGSQQLVATNSPHGGAGELRINGARPSDVNGVIMDAQEFVPHIVGGRRDAHGCNPSAGFVWCASRGECLQPFRNQCADLSASVQEIAQEVSSWDADSSGGRFGGRRDEHGCMGSGGFVWCASAGECVQPWATNCASLQEQIQEAQPEPAQASHVHHYEAPEPAEGDWVNLGHGGCRTAGGSSGTYTVMPGRVHSVRGSQRCRDACAASSSCVAYELRTNDGRCELHTEPITKSSPHPGYVCYAKAEVARVQSAPLQHTPSIFGGTRDEHNCLGSSGYTWCPSLSECVRGYAQSCPGGTETCQRLCAEEPSANDGLRFSCTCSEGLALDHLASGIPGARR